jgi:hypothetical protein
MLIERWKEQVISAKSKGFTDLECAQSARVSLAQLKMALTKDPEFAVRYTDAAENAPPKAKW